MHTTPDQLRSLSDSLLNVSGNVPLHERFRALFTLKAVGGEEAVKIIAEGFKDPSALIKHELAYVLGQIRPPSPLAIPILQSVLIDSTSFHGDMVRHEAAEALGALSSLESLELLKGYRDREGECRAVRETCEIAVDKIEFDHFTEEGRKRGVDPNFPTTDPAPASTSSDSSSASTEITSIPTLRSTLLNTSLPLFLRYRAMFALRNIAAQGAGTGKEGEKRAREGVRALAEGFGDESALFRHEVAYIFGQLSSPYSIPSLLRVMRSPTEDDMVRHEAAEALGGIASEGNPEEDEYDGEGGGLFDSEEDRRKGVLGILREWCTLEEAPVVVRESCQVAVDMWEYENSNQFQYADGLHAENVTDQTEGQEQKQRLTGMDRGVQLEKVVA